MRRTSILIGALAALWATGTASAGVLRDADGHLAGLTGVVVDGPNGERTWWDVAFVAGGYQDAYGVGYTTLPAGWPHDQRGATAAWSGVLRSLQREGVGGTAFAGGGKQAHLPWLATGLQSGWPCAICLRTLWGQHVPAEDRWSTGGLAWVRTAASQRWPADARGPEVTWMVFTATAPVPEPATAALAIAGVALLAAARMRQRTGRLRPPR